MNIKPGEEKIVVVRDRAEEITAAGLAIPTGAREVPNTGVIVAVGEASAAEPARMDIYMKGDRVVFSKYAGVEMNIGGTDVTFLGVLDVLGVIEAGVTVRAREEA